MRRSPKSCPTRLSRSPYDSGDHARRCHISVDEGAEGDSTGRYALGDEARGSSELVSEGRYRTLDGMRLGKTVAIVALIAAATTGCTTVASSTSRTTPLDSPATASPRPTGFVAAEMACRSASTGEWEEFTVTTAAGTPVTQINWESHWDKKYDRCRTPRRLINGEFDLYTPALVGEDSYRRAPFYSYQYCIPSQANNNINQETRTRYYDKALVADLLSACPDHPWADQWRQMQQQTPERRPAPDNAPLFIDTEFTSGGHERVGRGIEPGTYLTTNAERCYWERIDRQGDIIDNHYSNARRVVVTIDDGDYDFYSRGCGVWRQR